MVKVVVKVGRSKEQREFVPENFMVAVIANKTEGMMC